MSSDLCWQDGHKGDPKWGCAFEVHSGNLSLMKRTRHHWSSGGKYERELCRTFQWTLCKSCADHCSLFFRIGGRVGVWLHLIAPPKDCSI